MITDTVSTGEAVAISGFAKFARGTCRPSRGAWAGTRPTGEEIAAPKAASRSVKITPAQGVQGRRPHRQARGQEGAGQEGRGEEHAAKKAAAKTTTVKKAAAKKTTAKKTTAKKTTAKKTAAKKTRTRRRLAPRR